MLVRAALGIVLAAIMVTGIVNGHNMKELVNVERTILIANRTLQKFLTHFKQDILTSDSEKAMKKDMFKISVLRTAYDRACLKLALRQCFLGCRRARDYACAVTKCKEQLKEDFKQYSKTGCIDAFNARSSEHGGKIKPATTSRSPRNFPSTKLRVSAKPGQHKYRRGYEKKCCENSRKRCNQGCKFATMKTCKKYNCNKALKERFIKHCKSECKKVYKSAASIRSEASEYDDDHYDDDYDDDDRGSRHYDLGEDDDDDDYDDDDYDDDRYSKPKKKKKPDIG